ncbi:MAG: trypsin-like peptidase domain-containing protein, partial [Planctomycetota bacterium]|nr:trypsin-like peptidase domain-containing protein [Planctomycetota bacterium]
MTSRAPDEPVDARSDGFVAFLAATSTLLLGLLVAHQVRPDWFGLATGSRSPAFVPRSGGDGPGDPAAREESAATLAQRIFADSGLSVVHVTKRSSTGFDPSSQEYVTGTGSGLVWDRAGHVVTCAHVFEDASGAVVTLGDGRRLEARLVGIDPDLDLAVVRIDAPAEDLVPIRLGSSDAVRVGMTIFSIGCPYGLGPSLSQGIVSGLGRTLQSTTGVELEGTIQVDVAMHLGSSGGALLDDEARLIGMNAAIYLGSKRQAGVGFALPVDRLIEAVPRLMEAGYRWAPRFGFVTFSDADSAGFLEGVGKTGGAPPSGVVGGAGARGRPAAEGGV